MQVTPSFRFRLLGPFQVRRSPEDEPLALRRKTSALLAYLAATGQAHTRQALADIFCQETDDPQAALRSLLSRLRQRLGPAAILTQGESICLNRAISWVDCLELARQVESRQTPDTLDALADAVDLYHGDFLANMSLDGSPEFELWLLNQRARYRGLYERGLQTLVAQFIERGDLAQAIHRAQALVQCDPLAEEAHARLMWLYASTGRREAALAQFEECRRVLARELAVEPAPELVALRAEIAAGRLRPPRSLSTIPPAAPPALAPATGDFVGREAEMAQLHQAWRTSTRDQSQVVLVAADAGMGKTRLVQEFARTLPEVLFLTGECYESTRALSYAPWLELLERRLAQLNEESLQQLSAFAGDYLARLLPAFARRRKRRAPPIPPVAGNELTRLFTAVAEFLFELPGAPPLLLLIDNLQWADEASLQLFHFLARRTVPGQVLLAGAYRTEELEDSPALRALLNDLQGSLLLHLHLAPLNRRDLTQLVARLWPALPEGYRPHISDMLAGATGGNPLFCFEILRELAHGDEVPAALPVPKSVNMLVQRRLSQLPESARQVVEAMAVLDAPATPRQAQQISGRSEEETIAAIDWGLRRGLLLPPAEPALDRYDFSHDLLREAVIGQLSYIRRQLLHRRAALTLERSGVPAATLAHHWRRAGDLEREAHYALLAGEEAAAIYANEEAVRYLERALQLLDAPEQRIGVLCRLGDVLQLLGRRKHAETVYGQALALAEAADDRQAQARCQVALGRLMRLQGEYDLALRRLQAAQRIYQALDDRKGLAHSLGGLGAVYWSQLDYPRAMACFQQQLEIARRLDDRQMMGAAIGSLGVVYTEQGNYALALAYQAQRLQIDLALNDRLSLAKTIGNMGIVYAEQGEHSHALHCYRRLLQMMLEMGDRQSVCVAVGNMISVYTALGQLDLAERLAERAIALGRALNIPLYLCEFLYHSADLLARQGQPAAALAQAGEAAALAAAIGRTDVQLPARLLSIHLQVVSGELAAAQAVEELEALLAQWPETSQQAAIRYELCRLDPRQAHHRRQAAELYKRLYATTPNLIYRQRYQELTGEALPSPPPLPAPPELIAHEPPNLEALLELVDRLIE